jgi:benzoyl-CoA reductase subunit D
MMITAGIDVGAKNVKVVILKDGDTIATAIESTGIDEKTGIESALKKALKVAGISKDDLDKIVSTGIGSKLVDAADEEVSINIADARAMHVLEPSAKTVIDLGAEEGRVILTDEGRVTGYALNDRCAAGAGTFVDSMARILEVTSEQFGEMALKSENPSQISAQCTVFAESEVISLVSSDKTPEDIARAVVDAIAERTNAMSMGLTVERPVAMIGGTARNVGVVESLSKALQVDNLIIPENPDFVGALGAAIVAAEKAA